MTLEIKYLDSEGGTAKPVGILLVSYGATDALADFPLNRLISTIQCSINNNTISLQQSDVIDALLRLYDPEHLAMWDSKTPTCGDYLADYGDGVEALRFVLDWNGTLKTGVKALTVGADDFDTDGTREQAFVSHAHNVLGFDSIRPAGSSHCHRPRGIFKIDRIYTSGDGGITASGVPNADAATTKVYVQFTASEPLFLSQF